jgi:hypothetical protein
MGALAGTKGSGMKELGLWLAGTGVLALGLGLLVPMLERMGFTNIGVGQFKFTRLPGDIAIEHDNFRFYFPLTSALVISACVTVVIWIFLRPHG